MKYLYLLGMRLGEICALKWEDINLKKRIISVNKTMQRIYMDKGKTEVQIDDPKSISSIRKIPISQRLAERLRELQETYQFTGDEFVLTGYSDRYVEPRALERNFEKCLKQCRLKHYNFHALRHTFATNCIKIGMDPKSLSIVLGHSDVKITLDRYVHPPLTLQRKYIDKL